MLTASHGSTESRNRTGEGEWFLPVKTPIFVEGFSDDGDTVPVPREFTIGWGGETRTKYSECLGVG